MHSSGIARTEHSSWSHPLLREKQVGRERWQPNHRLLPPNQHRATLRSQIAFFTLRCAAPPPPLPFSLPPSVGFLMEQLILLKTHLWPDLRLPLCRPPMRLISICISKRFSSSGRILVRLTWPNHRLPGELRGSDYGGLLSLPVKPCELSQYNLGFSVEIHRADFILGTN